MFTSVYMYKAHIHLHHTKSHFTSSLDSMFVYFVRHKHIRTILNTVPYSTHKLIHIDIICKCATKLMQSLLLCSGEYIVVYIFEICHFLFAISLLLFYYFIFRFVFYFIQTYINTICTFINDALRNE